MKKLVLLFLFITFSVTVKSFTPDIHIKEEMPEDQLLKEQMLPLFFEHASKDHNPDAAPVSRSIVGRISDFVFWYVRTSGPKKPDPKKMVVNKAKKLYGATTPYIKTGDGVKISSLYFKRKDAPFNILLVTGYFEHLTPTKEWCAPFAALFPSCNVLSFDWRGFGSSTKRRDRAFGLNAYKDVNAAIKFLRNDNNKPIMVIGFCMGGAMALHSTLMANLEDDPVADALVINSPFAKFTDIMINASNDPDATFLQRLAARNRLIRYLRTRKFDGNIINIKPIDLVRYIKIPCLFEHFSGDKMAKIEDGIRVFKEANCPKMFLQADVGKHARIHTVTPYQYRNAIYTFLVAQGLLSEEQVEELAERERLW